MHPVGQFGIADSPLFLQKRKDTAVYCVKIGHKRIFCDEISDFHPFLRCTGKFRAQLRKILQPCNATLKS